jgi:LPS-assembly protein
MLLLSLIALLPLMPLPLQENVRVECKSGIIQPAGDGPFRCEGGGIVTYQDIRVEADWIEFDEATQHVTAGDRVIFTRGKEELTGGHLSFDLKSKTGTFANARGQIEGWYIQSGENERLENGQWRLKKSSATACVGDCPMWRWTSKEATVTPGERFSAKNMVFRFRNVPLLYFPKFSMPTESKERASGFLIPSTSTSTSKGRSVSEAFYWAIGRSYDATITGEYFSKRGPAGKIDFRAAPNPATRLDVSTLIAHDRLGQGGYRSSIRMFSGFGKNWRAVANVDVTSDFEFRQVYEESFNTISSPIEQSTVFATTNRRRSSLNAGYERTAVFFPGEPSTVLRKFPALDLQLPTNLIGGRIPVYFSFDGGVAAIARRDSQIDTPGFVPRADFHPSIQIPVLRSSLLTWSHQFGVRETFYSHSIDNGVSAKVLNRNAFDYTMKMSGPQFEKDYGKWKHLIEPTLEYRYVAGVDTFRKTIVVDETDLMTDTNEIEYGLTNRFIGSHEFLTWRVSQKLYFDPSFGGALVAGRRNSLEPLMDLTGFAFSSGEPRRRSPIVSTVRVATTPSTSTDIEVDYDTYRHTFSSAGIMGGISKSQFGSTIGYFFNKRTEIQPPSNQLRGLFTYGSQTRRGINAGFGFYYDIYRSLFQGSTTQLSYNAECYGLSVEFTQFNLGARIESRLRFSLSLKNLGSFGTLRPQERLF